MVICDDESATVLINIVVGSHIVLACLDHEGKAIINRADIRYCRIGFEYELVSLNQGISGGELVVNC